MQYASEKITMYFNEAKEMASKPKRKAWDAAWQFAETYINEKCLVSVGCATIADEDEEYCAIAVVGPDMKTVYKIFFIYEDTTKAFVLGYKIPDKWKDEEVINFCRHGLKELEQYEILAEKFYDVAELGKKIILCDS